MKRLKLTLLAMFLTLGASMLSIATTPRPAAAQQLCGNSECAKPDNNCYFSTGLMCDLTGGSCQGNVRCAP